MEEACIVRTISPINASKHLINRILKEDDVIKDSDFRMTIHSFLKQTNIVLIADVDRKRECGILNKPSLFPLPSYCVGQMCMSRNVTVQSLFQHREMKNNYLCIDIFIIYNPTLRNELVYKRLS